MWQCVHDLVNSSICTNSDGWEQMDCTLMMDVDVLMVRKASKITAFMTIWLCF